MNPLLDWILHHQRADWATAQTRANYERLYGPLAGSANPTPAQQAEGDRLWRSALGLAYQQERVRDALLNVRPSQDVASALFNKLGGARGTVTIPVLALGTGPNAATFAREIEVEVPGSATGAEMQQAIDDAIDAEAPYNGHDFTDYVILYGATAA